jgi:hypothetical protein
MTGEQLFNADRQARHKLILDYSNQNQFAAPSQVSERLRPTYQIARALDSVLPDYFKLTIQHRLVDFQNDEKRKKMVSDVIDEFIPIAITGLRDEYKNLHKNSQTNPKNLYELGGALRLAFGSNATRTISTKLGLLWERIACISPYALNPEQEFNIKLEGVDAIIYDVSNIFTYAQLKTQKNTLTGSQKGRSVEELTLHPKRLMVACFNTSASWTFSSTDVPRVVGKGFWVSIGFSYTEILNEVKRLMPLLDDEFSDLFE